MDIRLDFWSFCEPLQLLGLQTFIGMKQYHDSLAEMALNGGDDHMGSLWQTRI